MSQLPKNERFTLDHCLQYIDQKVFPLRSAEYAKRFPKWPGHVGLEVEMLPLMDVEGQKRAVPLRNGPKNLSDFLLMACERQSGWSLEIDQSNSDRILRVILDAEDQLTFEPGGQLEYSSTPYPCLSDALERMREVQSSLLQTSGEYGIQIVQTGINPWQTTNEIGLQMDKARYQAMTNYFNRIGEYGVRMMRQTCTIQVNLDFGADEQELMKRFVLAQLVAPIGTALFANSPFVDGKKSPYKSFRARIWQGVDPHRTGFPPGIEGIGVLSKKQDLVNMYLDYFIDAPVVFLTHHDFLVPPKGFTFRQWMEKGYEGSFPTTEDFVTHLSLHFPEVRCRGFLEMRSMDAQHRLWQSVPAGIYCGLFYDETACDAALDLLLPHFQELKVLWQKSAHGLDDKEVFDLAHKVFTIAREGLQRLPSCFREQFEDEKLLHYQEIFTQRQRCPADDMMDIVAQKGDISADIFDRLEEQWSQNNGVG